ncbi:hypothetical protein PAMA_001024 [Pampus argenteus]
MFSGGSWRLKWVPTVLHLGAFLQMSVWETTEAIHPHCELVVQHMKAQEECNQFLRQEEKDHSNRTGLILYRGSSLEENLRTSASKLLQQRRL